LLKKFPSVLCTGDVVPNPSHEVEHHIHMGGHSPVFAKPTALTKKTWNCKAVFKHLESASIIPPFNITMGVPLHMVPKKMGLGSLVVITIALI
jgi:hypothetical protein